jgi:predicted small secreted protein
MHRLIIAAGLLALCAGCNTVEGLGKDMQTAGGVLAGTAQGVQNGTTNPDAPKPLCAPDSQGRLPAGCEKPN